MKSNKNSCRIPTIWKQIVLMPTNYKKARKLIKKNKAVFRYTKDGIQYLKLLFKPSGFNVQPVILSLDPGSHFDGYTVLSSKCHHENIEDIHTQNIKKRMDQRRMYRRLRRSRQRNREVREKSQDKLTATIRNKLDTRIFRINSLLKLYPISKIVIEDVKKRGKQSKWFTQVMLGKTALYNYVENVLKLPLQKISGFITKSVRTKYFGKDPKNFNKGSTSFYAHCVDSFALAKIGLKKKFNQDRLNLKTRFVKKNWMVRRSLTKNKKLSKDKKRYFKYGKGGVKNYFRKFGKKKRVRVKPEGIIKPNHPGNQGWFWIYKKEKKDECFKHYSKPIRYGGTISVGQSRSSVPNGISKKAIWSNELNKILGYCNRQYQVVYT